MPARKHINKKRIFMQCALNKNIATIWNNTDVCWWIIHIDVYVCVRAKWVVENAEMDVNRETERISISSKKLRFQLKLKPVNTQGYKIQLYHILSV